MEITPVLPIAGQKFLQYFMGWWEFSSGGELLKRPEADVCHATEEEFGIFSPYFKIFVYFMVSCKTPNYILMRHSW
jgi:hypothetical protein